MKTGWGGAIGKSLCRKVGFDMTLRWFIVTAVFFVVAGCSSSNESQATQATEIVGQTQQALECDCSIGSTCYAEDDIDPSNSCNVCRSGSATDQWSRVGTPACEAGLTGEYFAGAGLSG